MKKKDVTIGKIYAVKVSGKVVQVKIINESVYGGWNGINTYTKRNVRIKTAGKLRYEVTPKIVKEVIVRPIYNI